MYKYLFSRFYEMGTHRFFYQRVGTTMMAKRTEKGNKQQRRIKGTSSQNNNEHPRAL
jgi:hypothetical protein